MFYANCSERDCRRSFYAHCYLLRFIWLRGGTWLLENGRRGDSITKNYGGIFMGKLYNSLPITGVAKTITDIIGIDPPKQAEQSIDIIHNAAKAVFQDKNADRVFMYNPDAIALWLFQKYTAMFEKAFLHSNIQVPIDRKSTRLNSSH